MINESDFILGNAKMNELCSHLTPIQTNGPLHG